MKKRFFGVALLILGSLIFSSCGSNNRQDLDDGQGDQGGTEIISNEPYSIKINNSNNGIVNLDYNPQLTYKIVPSFQGDFSKINNFTFSYESLSPNYARVDFNGTVSFLKYTTEKIRIKVISNFNTKVFTYCDIYLRSSTIDEMNQVLSVRINQTNKTFEMPSQMSADFSASVSKIGNPSEKVNWIISNSYYASVNKKNDNTCTVIFKNTGSFQLKALSDFDPSKCDEITITVTGNSNPRVNSVEIHCTTTTIDLKSVTKQIQLTAEVNTIGLTTAVNWSSSVPSVAYVDSTGLVTGKMVGKTLIRATSKDDLTKYDEVEIEVINSTPGIVNSIVITAPQLFIELYNNVDRTLQLTATINATNVSDLKINWSSSETSVATVNEDGLVKGLSVGTTKITASSNFDPDVFSAVTITVKNSIPSVKSVTIFAEKDPILNLNEKFRYIQLNSLVETENAASTKVNWYSLNEYASVNSDGLVKGLSIGTATIKCVSQFDTTKFDTIDIEVRDSISEGLFINKKSAQLYPGEKIDLNAYDEASELETTNVTWSSDNENVASVDSNGLVTVNNNAKENDHAVIKAKFNENGNIYSTCQINVVESEYTILLYMCGSNLESGSGHFATNDLDEINSVNIPSNINVVVETGGSKRWQKKDSNGQDIPSDKLARYKAEGTSLKNLSYLQNASMGDEDTLEDFLKFGLTNYPAKKTGLVLWNHGGNMKGVCFDENFNDDALLTREVSRAVSDAKNYAKVYDNLEWIGYDACLMSVIDIASINANNFNYMISSQETEPAYGWNYKALLSYIVSNQKSSSVVNYSDPCDTEPLVQNIVDSYAVSMQEISNDYTLAGLDLTKIDPLVNKIEDFVGTYIKTKEDFNKLKTCVFTRKNLYEQQFEDGGQYVSYTFYTAESIHAILFSLSQYKGPDGYFYTINPEFCVDLKSIFKNVDQVFGISIYSEILSSLNNVVFYNSCGSYYQSYYGMNTCGLSLFFACDTSSYNSDRDINTYTLSDTKLKNLRDVNIKYSQRFE